MAVGFKGTSWEYVKPQTAQEKAVQNVQEKLTYTNVDPRITQRQNQSTYTPPSNNNGGGGDLGGGTPATTGSTAVGSTAVADPYASYYNQMINLYQQQLAEEKARQERVKQARIDAANTTYNTSMANLDNAKESSLRQAYIKHMQDQKALPQQMQAYGLSGGATETNLANMKNAYGSNRTSIMNNAMEQQRMIEQDKANAIASAEGDAANYEASAVRDYNNGLLDVYASALNDKLSMNTSNSTKDMTNNPWYKRLTSLILDEGMTTTEAVDELMRQGLDKDTIDMLFSTWESTM